MFGVPEHLGVDVPDERGLLGVGEVAGAEELRRRDERGERLVFGEARLHRLLVVEELVVAVGDDLQLAAVDAALAASEAAR